ncbi:MAG: SIMPL domain-containing protein, partial [Bacteroidota bacterium]
MKRLFFLLCGISLYSLLTAQHAGNIHQQQPVSSQHLQQAPVQNTPQYSPPTLDPNYFYVNVKVLYNQVPDAFLAIFNVMQLGKDAEDANVQMGTRIDAILAGLDEMGIDRSEVFIDMISQIPIYEYEVQKKVFSKTYQEIPAGIELQKNLHIRFKDGNLMERIVRLMAQQEVFELVKVDYLIEDQGKILQEVRKAALAYSQEEIKSYSALGVQYDTLPVLFNDSRRVIFPLTRYMSYPSKASSSLKEK